MPEKKAFLLRVDPDVFDAVQKWAADDLRSANAQIEFILRQALRNAGRLSGRVRPGRQAPH
ncbi:MAG: hypothetical protein ACRDGT_00560 [Candidatus Limnocylindria bacterium]